MSHDARLMAGVRLIGGVVMAIALAGCSSDGAERGSPPPAEATSTTTSPAAVASAAAREACSLGDTSSGSTNVGILRRALTLRGENVAGLNNDAVIARWRQLSDQIGKAADDLQRQAAVMTYGEAKDAAAKAAALDPRWEQLHRGLSAYAAYLGSQFARPSDAEVKGWFEGIRLGCERARAAPGP